MIEMKNVVFALIAAVGTVSAPAAPVPAESSAPPVTRKVVLEKIEAGGYRWKLIEAAAPPVGDHQVLVRMRAVALNRGDLELLEPDPDSDHDGRIVASDGAGDVVEVGSGVKGIRKGARVTSTYFRRTGDVVLVQGTGGVSVFALQFAAASGARVIVTSSSDEKLRRARELGARDGINYRTTPAWADRVLEVTDRHGADLVVDVGGKDTLEQSVESLAYSGTLSIVGGLSGYGGNIPSLGLLMRSASAQGIFVGSRADYGRMSAFINKHRLHPVIDRIFPLEQYDEALKHMASGNFVGKIVIRL